MLLAGMIALSAQAAIIVTPAEMAQKAQWVQQNLLTDANPPPFSFTYNGQASSILLPTWARSETDTILDANRTQHSITWSNSSLELTCVATEYNDYPLVEWTVYLQNIGTATTPILQGIQGLDTTITRTSGPEFILNGNQGDNASASSYEPYQITLNPSSLNSFSPPASSGKSCDTTGWPYYNLQVPGGGMILAIGWPGQWASSFSRDATTDLRIQAGQQLTHLVLNPGEKIRTPLVALLFWQGTNVVRSQNLWRHWYLAHEIPLVNGQPPSTISQVQGDSTSVVQSYLAAAIQPDILWRDAGSGPGTTWYPSANGPYTGNNTWLNTGTWVVDPTVYPNGFHRTSGQVNALGVKFLLWFEPERIGNTINSFLATNNPAWILSATSTTVGDILNEGNPGAFNWLTNQIESLIVANGINWYREDMNGNGPLPAWQNNDASNRQGITENFYVQGHLAYWDALLAMNPGLRIDCCGSGGRRNDLEAMSRAVPLTRTDYLSGDMATVPDGNQCQTYGLSSWLPFQGGGSYFNDPYSFRSMYMASFGMVDGLTAGNTPAIQQAYAECKKIAPIMLNGDYYPLTPYSQAQNAWMAWQFDWPGANEGCVQIFCRTNSTVSSMTFQLQGLNPAQIYDVSNFDTGDLGWFTGSALMSSGIAVQLGPRQSAILYYTSVTTVAQFPVDSSLCLWLNAGTLTGSVQNQTTLGISTVPAWTSSDNYHTILAVPLIGEAVNDPSNHTPQLLTFTNNGAVFQAVQFRQDCDPITPDVTCSPSGHLADRLWQINNLGAFDPTAISPTNDITLIVVYKNDDVNLALGPSQCILAKRGPGECPFEFGLDASASKSMYVVYAGSTAYDSGNTYPGSPEWGIAEMNVTSGGELSFREYFASQGGWQNYAAPAARGSSGASAVSTAYWSAASTPMSLGFHCQSIGATLAGPFGNGEDERFAGEIAEVGLYSRSLSQNELASVESYLLTKYVVGLQQLGIENQAGQSTLTWTDATAILQSSSQVAGPWSNVIGAKSPYSIIPSGGQLFFRLEH